MVIFLAESLKGFYYLEMRIGLVTFALFLLPSLASAQFGFHTGAHFGYSKLGAQSGELRKRDLGAFDLQFMPGYRLPADLMAGLMLEYRLMGQLDEDSRPGYDLSGNSFNMGIGGTWEPGPIKLLFSWDLYSRHYVTGGNNTYMGSGYHFLIGFRFLPGFSFDVEYVTNTYDTQSTNGADYGLNDYYLDLWNVGLGVSYSY